MILLWLATTRPVSAAEPCGGLALDDGIANPATALAAATPMSTTDQSCIAHVAGQLAGRQGLRTVTVTVKVRDEHRADGTGDAVLGDYTAALIAGGLPSARVSGVVAAGAGEVFISYTERTVARVGVLEALSGEVAVENQLGNHPALAGEPLSIGNQILTGAQGRATLSLADRSRVQVLDDSQVRIVAVSMNEDLQRQVVLEVVRGGVDVLAEPAGAGASFRVQSEYGTAGVRGTAFRYRHEDGGMSRLETLEGSVELVGDQGVVKVDANFGSRIDSAGQPEPAAALPASPQVRWPLRGDLGKRGLSWRTERGASFVQIELAGDAEFTHHVQWLRAPAKPRSLSVDLPEGRWYWRLAAIDERGMLGSWSQVYAFQVQP